MLKTEQQNPLFTFIMFECIHLNLLLCLKAARAIASEMHIHNATLFNAILRYLP